MTTKKQDIDTALARLAEAFPQAFVLEKHRPLKVGIAVDIPARCPAVERRVMYLQGMVAGAARVDLDGNPAGEVTARDAEYAAARLAETLASREARRVAAVEAKGKVAAPVARPAAVPVPAATTVSKGMRDKPVLRLRLRA